MNDVRQKLEDLLSRDNWTEEERQWLLRYLDAEDNNELWRLMQDEFVASVKQQKSVDHELSQSMLHNIHEAIGVREKETETPVISLWVRRLAVAACAIGLIILAAIFFTQKTPQPGIVSKHVKTGRFKNDVLPGGNKAVLTLADGSTILLDDAKNGDLAQQGNTKVIKIGAKLSYDAIDKTTGEVLYNTISTPRGGQYQIELADGSRVWLNASSSIRFPAAFTGGTRKVDITGEAYFEVAKNKSMPFIVGFNGAEVQVLGTHFNINAYGDESAMKTTLLEGAVKVVKGTATNLLKPGQQSQISQNGALRIVDGVDVEEVMAWKNGLFYFHDANLPAIMKQVSRWYDVDVVYQNRIVKDEFVMEMPRNSKLSDVLKVLELSGKIEFEIEGKRIVVKNGKH